MGTYGDVYESSGKQAVRPEGLDSDYALPPVGRYHWLCESDGTRSKPGDATLPRVAGWCLMGKCERTELDLRPLGSRFCVDNSC